MAQAQACVVCQKALQSSESYLRPGDGAVVCARCYLSADHSSLKPPDPPGYGEEPEAAVGVFGLITRVLLAILTG
jgi:hypothetical protein